MNAKQLKLNIETVRTLTTDLAAVKGGLWIDGGNDGGFTGACNVSVAICNDPGTRRFYTDCLCA